MKRTLSILLFFTTIHCFGQSVPNTLSPADKVYGLSKFWQEVNYNFVYLDKIDRRAWDSTYKALIPQVQQTRNDYEYYRLMARFCASLKDGHTNIYPPGSIGGLVFGKMFGDHWFGLEAVGGKAIINRILKSEANELPIGTEVTAVNGIPTQQYSATYVEPYISSSTDYVRKRWAIENLLSGLLGTSYDVTFKRPGGKVFSLHLTHARTTDTAFYPAFPKFSLLELKWYPSKIAYLALNSFGDDKIDSIFKTKLPELYDAKALIIDLRNNGGGSTGTGTTILQYLVKDTVMQHSRYFTRDHLPAFKAWGAFLKPKDTLNNSWNAKAWKVNHDQYYYSFDYSPDTIHLNAKRLVVPTAILTGNNTASAAEDFLISAGNQAHMVRIGEPSFGSTGQPYQFDLVGGFVARICTKKDTWPDGSAFVGVGVQPDIAVSPTVKDFMDHKDPVLDKALQYLHQKVRK
ncbi:S41 family peptidase [soil metagenome]|jgi:C-terminal processing protease CtpA/Prc